MVSFLCVEIFTLTLSVGDTGGLVGWNKFFDFSDELSDMDSVKTYRKIVL